MQVSYNANGKTTASRLLPERRDQCLCVGLFGLYFSETRDFADVETAVDTHYHPFARTERQHQKVGAAAGIGDVEVRFARALLYRRDHLKWV